MLRFSCCLLVYVDPVCAGEVYVRAMPTAWHPADAGTGAGVGTLLHRRLPTSVRPLERDCLFSDCCSGTIRRWVTSCSCCMSPAWGSQSAALNSVDVGSLEFNLIALFHLTEDHGWWRLDDVKKGLGNREIRVVCLQAAEENPGKVLGSVYTQTFTDAHRDQRETIWLNLNTFLHCYIIVIHQTTAKF